MEKRVSKVEAIVKKRVFNLGYIQKMHDRTDGGPYSHVWLNSVKLTPHDIMSQYSDDDHTVDKKTTKWFYLCLGFGKIIRTETAATTIRACSQLMAEYEYLAANPTVQYGVSV